MESVYVAYEDEYVVAINKPSGLVVHSDGRTEEPTLVEWILERYPGSESIGEPWEREDGVRIARPGIVHRIDRETSGVLLVAKTQEAFVYLKERFQKREVEKKYNAFVYGVLKDKRGIIDRPIGRSKSDFRLWSSQRGARGRLRDAVTEYVVLGQGDIATYLEVRPKTGRTHQIRVHLKAIHHSVVCDKLYAPNQPCILGFKRLALHARSLSLILPDGKRIVIEAPLPKDFQRAYANFVE